MNLPELKTQKPSYESGKLVHRVYCSRCLKSDCEHMPHLMKPRTCKCGKQIIFAKTPTGRFQPLVPETLESHFADCPMARDFRKTKKSNSARL